MKKRTLFSFFFFCPFLFFISCKKQESSTLREEGLTIAKAKHFFSGLAVPAETTEAVASAQRNARKQLAKIPLWNKAYTIKLAGIPSVMVPVQYASPLYLTGNFSGQKAWLADDITRLLVYTDRQNNYHANLLTYFPDSDYSAGGAFTGIIFVDDWSGDAITKYKIGKDHSVSQWDGNLPPLTPASAIGTDAVHDPDLTVIVSTCTTIYGYNYSADDPENGYAYTEDGGCVYNIISSDDGAGTGYGGGSGLASAGTAGGGSSGFLSSTVIIASGNNIIGNIKDYDKCFTNTGGTGFTYSVTVCVDQPVPGTRETWGLTPSDASASANPIDVGHVFMVFTEKSPAGVVTRNIGLYPSGSVSPSSPSSGGQLNNDASHGYDISLTVSATSEQFFNMLNYVAQNATAPYNLNSNNCTSFTLHTLYAGDIYLPATVGTWPGGSGNDPGDLGEDIRSMTLSAGETRNTVSDSHPNLGTCN
ncbi:MAG TPA: hypothetical protein VKR53_03340 [Puia sp.]|nr:hypothetical protein [Puia sp.]